MRQPPPSRAPCLPTEAFSEYDAGPGELTPVNRELLCVSEMYTRLTFSRVLEPIPKMGCVGCSPEACTPSELRASYAPGPGTLNGLSLALKRPAEPNTHCGADGSAPSTCGPTVLRIT